jgi:hypothetical protein
MNQNSLEELWLGRVRDWANSGESMTSFSSRQTWSGSSLGFWVRRFRSLGVDINKKQGVIPVHITDKRIVSCPGQENPHRLFKREGAWCVEISPDVSTSYLIQLLQGLS